MSTLVQVGVVHIHPLGPILLLDQECVSDPSMVKDFLDEPCCHEPSNLFSNGLMSFIIEVAEAFFDRFGSKQDVKAALGDLPRDS